VPKPLFSGGFLKIELRVSPCRAKGKLSGVRARGKNRSVYGGFKFFGLAGLRLLLLGLV
jgi:hypothetical protein